MRNQKDLIASFANGAVKGEASNMFINGNILYSYGEHFPMAVRTARDGSTLDFFIINGDRYSNSTAKQQSYVFRGIPNTRRVEIPFSALASMMGLRLNSDYVLRDVGEAIASYKIRVIDWENDKYVDTGRVSEFTGEPIMEHYLGAVLFTYDGNHYLSAIDESGTNGGLFFLTQLVKPVETVADAYEAMKPEEVKEAEENGVRVLRQGEFFFVEMPPAVNAKDTPIHKDFRDRKVKNYCLKHREEHNEWRESQNHVASEGFAYAYKEGQQFVRGIVKHNERQHKQLKLYDDVKEKGWWQVHEALYVQSWGAVGNVD